jgi:HEAT repeat protein
VKAVIALGKIGDVRAVPALISALKDSQADVRRNAASALGKIGDTSAVVPLLEALCDTHAWVRGNAVIALGKIGDASILPTLYRMLKDTDSWVRENTLVALGNIGDIIAVPDLIHSLKDDNREVRRNAAFALGTMGDADSLPRKILSDPRFTTQERIALLEKLRKGRYEKNSETLPYLFPETETFCLVVLDEDDNAARENAQAILNWLHGGRYLMRASERDNTRDSEELVRAIDTGSADPRPETLVRSVDDPAAVSAPTAQRRSLLHRFFGKREDNE